MRGGYWKRPMGRTYTYNLDLGEHYYSPMTSYLEAERGTRGETPGALTFSERLSQRWLYGRRYEATDLRDRYARASSLARDQSSYLESEMASRSARAASEMRTASTRQTTAAASSSSSAASKQQMIAASMSSQRQSASTQQEQTSRTQQKKVSIASTRQEMLQSSKAASSSRVTEDDICKKVADIRMSPWSAGQELSEAQAASARARARILELERELEEITRKAMTTQTRALKSARQMAAEAYQEDEAAMASSSKKTRKVMIESSSKMTS